MRFPTAYCQWRKDIAEGFWYLDTSQSGSGGKAPPGETELLRLWDAIETQCLSKHTGLLKLDIIEDGGLRVIPYPAASGLNWRIPFPGDAIVLESDIEGRLVHDRRRRMEVLIARMRLDFARQSIPYPLQAAIAEWQRHCQQGCELYDSPEGERGLELALAIRPHVPSDFYLEWRDFREIVMTADGSREIPLPIWAMLFRDRILPL